ncbi:MAG TPA: AAA family ATPase, partial [Caldilineaceae bacterium]|nr:AAA family ATPase [Caldilineaceae bacterium]
MTLDLGDLRGYVINQIAVEERVAIAIRQDKAANGTKRGGRIIAITEYRRALGVALTHPGDAHHAVIANQRWYNRGHRFLCAQDQRVAISPTHAGNLRQQPLELARRSGIIAARQAWKPLIISDNTHNGGSGKTFTMSILMTFLAEEGYHVLGMDNDPQGDLGRYFVSKDDVPNFMWEVYRTEKIEPHMIQKTAHKNIDIISATLEFAEKEDPILSKRYREYVLKRALERSQELLARYHFIFIDNHPALGTVQFNSMVAADAALIVNDCRKLSKNSPDAVIDAIDHARTQLVGVVMNRIKGGTNKSREALNYARSKYGDRVFQTVMPEWENLSIKDKFAEAGEEQGQVNIMGLHRRSESGRG